MMKHFIFISIFCIVTSPLQADEMIRPSEELTLKECYQLALKQSETVAKQAYIIKEAEGRFYQSLSGILPDVSFVLTDKRQDDNHGLNARRVPERKFTFSQPLFSGFKEFAAMAASRAEKRQRLSEKKRAEELLFVDVSDAFFFSLQYQEEIKALDTIRTALHERIKELQKREELGRSRPSEMASADARLSRVEADYEGLVSDGEIARQLLEFLTGQLIDHLVDETINPVTEDKNAYLQRADHRADVLASWEAYQVAKKKIAVARAGFFPEVSLDGNYYTKRTGASADIDWDTTLTVDVPIFQGGENMGKVKEAKAVAFQEELTFKETKRKAALNIENAYTRLTIAVKKEEAFKKAFEATKKNFDLQREDYTHNLVNNLDVLQALEDFQESQRDYVIAQNETKRFYWQLKVAVGEIDVAF